MNLFRTISIVMFHLNKTVAILAFLLMLYFIGEGFSGNGDAWGFALEQCLAGIFFWWFGDFIKKNTPPKSP